MSSDPDLPFTCYRFDDPRKPMGPIRVAGPRRAWMDEMHGAPAYRCLPLVMANQHGWELTCPVAVSATWTGGMRAADLSVRIEGLADAEAPVFSHFGNGILSFGIPAIFQTPEGMNLWVSGPANRFKDGAQALSALVETDWMPFTFSINWKLTRPGLEVCFEPGEPIPMMFPVHRGDVEAMQPRAVSIHAAPMLRDQALRPMTWRQEAKGDRVQHQRWYMRGEMPDGSTGPAEHQTALKVRPFPDMKSDT